MEENRLMFLTLPALTDLSSILDQTSSSNQNVSILDFERSVMLHLPDIKPKQVFSKTFTYYFFILCIFL